MNLSPRRVLLVANPDKPDAPRLARAAIDMVRDCFGAGTDALLSTDSAEDLSARNADLVMVFGGDGTVLGAYQRLGAAPPPILGVNLGQLGYLAEFAPGQAREALAAARDGRLRVSERMTLDAAALDAKGEVVWRGGAVNEILLTTGVPGRILYMSVATDAEPLLDLAGDGVLVATPTGSTAYSFSAGGPVLDPDWQALALVPVCAHRPFTRPLAAGPATRFHLCPQGSTPGRVSADGRVVAEVAGGGEVLVTGSARAFRLLTPAGQPRYEVLRRKLGWGAAPKAPHP